MKLERRHWSVALIAAVFVHAAPLALLIEDKPASGAVSAGYGGIEVDLGVAGGAPGSVAAAEPPPPELAAQPPEPDVVEAIEPPPQAVEAVAPPEAVPVESPEPVKTVQAEPPPKPKPRKPPPPPAAKPLPPQEVAKAVAPAPAPEPPAETPSEQASIAGAAGKAGTQAAPQAGSGPAASAGGAPGAAVDYMARLQAWLERHKEYPRAARMRRQEGVVMLRFTIGRDGRVLAHRIENSSGHRLLDAAVEEMIQRANPLPAPPPEIELAQLELVVPVQFQLR